MKAMLLVPLIVVAAIVAVVAVVVVIGACLPVEHVATRERRLDAPPAAVWRALTRFGDMPTWRAGLRAVERVADRDGHEVWRETNRRGEAIDYETLESVPARRLVRRIATAGLPFAGQWTIDLEPSGTGCVVRAREDGAVYNPLFRFASRFVIGHDATLAAFLTELAASVDASTATRPPS